MRFSIIDDLSSKQKGLSNVFEYNSAPAVIIAASEKSKITFRDARAGTAAFLGGTTDLRFFLLILLNCSFP